MYVSKFEENNNGEKITLEKLLLKNNYSGRSKQDNDLPGIHSKFLLLLF